MTLWADLGLGAATKKTSTRKRRGVESVEIFHQMECSGCPLNEIEDTLYTPKMRPTGSRHPLIYCLGEAPGKREDAEGEQFIGKSGALLREQIPEEFADQIRWSNTVRCRPPKNRTPVFREIECCRPFHVRDIEKTKPKVIFAFGGVPLSWLTASDGINRWRGRYSPVKVGNHVCWAFYFLHPAYILRQRDLELIFVRDLKHAFELLEILPEAEVTSPLEPLRTPTNNGLEGNGLELNIASSRALQAPGNGVQNNVGLAYKNVSYVTGHNPGDFAQVEAWFDKLMKANTVAIDLETTTSEKSRDRQIRPFANDAKILTVALAAHGHSFAFPLRHKNAGWTSIQLAKLEALLTKFLRKTEAVKVAHNLAFELEWLAYFYGKDLIYRGDWGDTMGQAYVLDERHNMLSLDDLTLLHFGFALKKLFSLNMGALENEPLEKILPYNALDSLYEYRLYLKQRKLLKEEGLWGVYLNHVPPVLTTVLTQLGGNVIDFQLVKDLDGRYSGEISQLEEDIDASEEALEFQRVKGKKFKPGSHQNVISLFRDILQREECKDPETGRFSADDEVLKQIDLPIAQKLRRFRALSGHKSKYIDPIQPEANECVFPDKRVHPNIHVFFTRTGRTSSSFPNSQFWPKREEEFRELRAEFVAEPGCWMVAIDQGQIEARVIEMAAKDKRYGNYLWDRHDVHMDWTERLAYAYPARIGGKKFLRDKDVLKKFRHDVKNQWTFPLFFGASANSASRYLTIPINVIGPMVDQFWDEFSGIKAWQEDLEVFYNQHGYVECLTGRRRRAPISHNKLINSPIQGTASDITVSAYSRLSKAAFELDMWQFQARLEVHDELVFQIPKKTFDRDLEFVVDHMLDCQHYPFINVPLCVEVSRGPDWYHQEPVMTVFSDELGKLDRKACGF